MVDSLQETGNNTVDMSPWATETMVKFGVLLPEAKSLEQVSAQSNRHKTEEGGSKQKRYRLRMTETVAASQHKSSMSMGRRRAVSE